MIYAIDFDGTIVENKFPEIGKFRTEACAFIRKIQARGDKWILWTLRSGEKQREALQILYDYGLYPDAVNDNLPEVKAQWPDNPNPRKIFADVYIDDHNAGGLKFCDLNCPCDDPVALGKPDFTPAQEKIIDKCNELQQLLLEKNRKYGDSALNPCRVFSRANAEEQILVRIDDKLNRIKNRQDDEDEDVIMDLAGYLILLMIAREKEKGE